MQFAAIHNELSAASRADGLQGPHGCAEHGRRGQNDFQPHLVNLLEGREVSALGGEGETINPVADMFDVHQVGTDRVGHGNRLHHDLMVHHSEAPRLYVKGSFHQPVHSSASNQNVLVRCNRVHGSQVANAGFWTPWTARGWRS